MNSQVFLIPVSRQTDGVQVPDDSSAFAALRRQILETLVDDEVLYQRARRDTTINVTDSEVQGAVDQQVRDVRARFSSDNDFRVQLDRKSTRLNSSHIQKSRMPSSA